MDEKDMQIKELQKKLFMTQKDYLGLCSKTGVDKVKAECEKKVDVAEKRAAKLESKNGLLTEQVEELKSEVRELRSDVVQTRRELKQVTSERDRLKKELEGAEEVKAKVDQLTAENKDLRVEKEKLTVQVSKLTGQVKHQEAVLNRDSTTSSKPSSTDNKSKKKKKDIQNNRETTQRKPGGQPNHPHHPRVLYDPTGVVNIQAPACVLEDESGRYVDTGYDTVHQLVDFDMRVVAINYVARKYRDTKTGKIVTGAFPEGVQNEVNYGPNVKGMCVMLNDYCNVSYRKVFDYLNWSSHGGHPPSIGFMSELQTTLANMTYEERLKWAGMMMDAHVMHSDATLITINGLVYYVYVCAADGYVLFFLRESKGYAGIKGTPVEHTHAVLIHDHDVCFYEFSDNHQECLIHILRYLLDSIVNEPDRKWNKEMREFIQKLIHEAKQNDQTFTDERIAQIELEYDTIIKKGLAEYDEKKHDEGYVEGYRLLHRLNQYADETLLFIRDPKVPYTNNLSERLLRVIKRKLRQVTTFRAVDSVLCYLGIISYILTVRDMGKNPFDEVVRLFGTLYSIPTDGLTNAEYWQKHVERVQAANKFIAEERKEMEAAKPAAEAEKKEHTKSQSKRNKARKEKRERKLQNIAL